MTRNSTRRPVVAKQRRKVLADLRSQLRAAEDTLRALRAGEVDAMMVTRAGDERVVTLQGAELPYRILLDQMYAGAVTLTPVGVIVYCNRRFADLVRTAAAHVIGSTLSRFVQPAHAPLLAELVERARSEATRGELTGRAGDGTPIPLAVTFAPLRLEQHDHVTGVIGVLVDATERMQQEAIREQLIEQVMTAQEHERGRIARELHDETGQSLTALLVGLRTIEGSRTVAQAKALAQRLRTLVAQTLDEVGRLARGLRPSLLDDLGLAAAATRQVQEFAQSHGIPVDLHIEGLDAGALSPLLQTTVYRVLQEALTNVARHAHARRASVRLVRDDGTVELRVHDDGTGLPPGDPTRLGLRGMRERATLLGGSIEAESPPGGGTTITARFPLRGA